MATYKMTEAGWSCAWQELLTISFMVNSKEITLHYRIFEDTDFKVAGFQELINILERQASTFSCEAPTEQIKAALNAPIMLTIYGITFWNTLTLMEGYKNAHTR